MLTGVMKTLVRCDRINIGRCDKHKDKEGALHFNIQLLVVVSGLIQLSCLYQAKMCIFFLTLWMNCNNCDPLTFSHHHEV